MVMTSTDIQNQSFSIDRKGYDVDEVDVFLEHVGQELDDMSSQITQMQSELDNAKSDGFGSDATPKSTDRALKADIAERDAHIAELESKLREKEADGNAIAQALIIAQRSGDEIVSNALSEAEHTRFDAEEEAQRILDKANNEKQKVLDAIEALENDREEVRAEYQELLTDFVDSANEKLSEIKEKCGVVNSQAKHTSDRVMPRAQAPIKRDVSPATATYTTPQTSPVVVTPSTPTPSKVEKDFSGFGEADDTFEFEEID